MRLRRIYQVIFLKLRSFCLTFHAPLDLIAHAKSKHKGTWLQIEHWKLPNDPKPDADDKLHIDTPMMKLGPDYPWYLIGSTCCSLCEGHTSILFSISHIEIWITVLWHPTHVASRAFWTVIQCIFLAIQCLWVRI